MPTTREGGTTPRPVTRLDERFSEPDATATDWAETQAVLEGAEISWISTVRADGRPHVTPLVCVWLDGAAHFSTGPGEQKALNLDHDPAVALTTGCNTWESGLDVVVEGRAERVTDPDELTRLAEAWTRKWRGQWRYVPVEDGFHSDGGGFARVYRVAPGKVLAFAKGTFGHTRHVFPDAG